MICSLSIHLFSISNDCLGPHFDVYCMVFMMRNLFGEIEIKVAEVCNFHVFSFTKGSNLGNKDQTRMILQLLEFKVKH